MDSTWQAGSPSYSTVVDRETTEAWISVETVLRSQSERLF